MHASVCISLPQVVRVQLATTAASSDQQQQEQENKQQQAKEKLLERERQERMARLSDWKVPHCV